MNLFPQTNSLGTALIHRLRIAYFKSSKIPILENETQNPCLINAYRSVSNFEFCEKVSQILASRKFERVFTRGYLYLCDLAHILDQFPGTKDTIFAEINSLQLDLYFTHRARYFLGNQSLLEPSKHGKHINS